MFGKYFRNEKISYWFPCFAPFLLLLEIELYVGATQRPGLEIWEILDELLEPLLLSIGCVMLGAQILIQIISSIYFFCKIRRLSEQQKEELRYAARYSTKTGRILQTEDVLVYYGMVYKDVLLKSEIKKMRVYKEREQTYIRGGSMVSESNWIRVELKSKKNIDLLCSMRVLDGYKGELPWKTLVTVILFGLFLLFLVLYPVVMGLFYPKGDEIEKVLFYAGYEWLFWLVGVISIVIVGVKLIARAKKRAMDDIYKGIVIKAPMIWFVLIGFIIAGGCFWNLFCDSWLGRKDLKLYRKEQYEEIEIQCEDAFKNMYSYGNDYLKAYLEEREMDGGCVLGTVDCGERYKQEYYFCYIGNLDDWEIGKTYRVQYLKNTGIVVGVEKVK